MGLDLAGPTPITLLPPFRAARPRAAADPTQAFYISTYLIGDYD
jgi:hypothetical protein